MAELGETGDPAALIPGKPEAIEQNARVLRGRAEGANQAADGLQSIDTGSWRGPAAGAFHDKFSYEPSKWFTAGVAMDSGAGALEAYAATLRWAQGQAGEALEHWNQAQAATAQAKTEHQAASQRAASQGQPEPAFSDPGNVGRQAAQDLLNRARVQLTEAGDTAATALREATQPAPTESSWLDDVGNFAKDAGAHLVNGLASFGNAMVNHPGDVVTAAAGIGLTMISSTGEGLGVVLDATGVGAVAGVPLNIVSAAGMAAGATMTGAAVANMAVNAAGDDHVEPMRTGGSQSSSEVRELTSSEQRSVRSLQRNVEEHEAKLEQYKANPDAYDNQGLLKNAPTPEIRQRIIDGRVRHLQNEINTFRKQVNDILGGHGS
jgi:hypothetical protein